LSSALDIIAVDMTVSRFVDTTERFLVSVFVDGSITSGFKRGQIGGEGAIFETRNGK